MPAIPYLIGKDVPMQPSSGVATYNPSIVADALEKGGQEFNQASIIAARQQKMQAMQDATDRKTQADKAALGLMYGDGTPDNPGLLSLKGANARDAETKYNEGMATIRSTAMSGVHDPYAEKQLNQSLDQMDLAHLGTLKAHMAQQSTAYSTDLLTAQNQQGTEAIATAPQDEQLFQDSLKNKITAAGNLAKIQGAAGPSEGNPKGDDMYQQAVRAATGQAISARLSAMYDNPDPAVQQQAYNMWQNNYKNIPMDAKTALDMDRLAKTAAPRLGAMNAFHDFTNQHSVATAQSTPEDIIKFVQGGPNGGGLEGGGRTVIDNNGYKTQYGLNSKWNGDLAIGSLTQDQAVAAAKERYWDKYKIGDMPKNMQAIAFDTYYNMSPDTAKILISESAGDPQRLLQLRENHYRQLGQFPENAPYLQGWLNRNHALGGKVSDGPINTNDAADYMKQLPQDQQEPFKALVDNFNGNIAAQHDQASKQTMDTALNFIAKNGKGYDFMPIGLQDSIDRLGMTQAVRDYAGRQQSDPSALAGLNQMDPATLAKTDLNTPGIRLNLSLQDYSRFKAKQVSMQQSPQAMDTNQQRFAMMKKAFFARGLNMKEKRDPNDPEKVTFDGADQYNRANGLVDEAIDAYVDKNKGYPPVPELQKMVDNVFTKVVTSPSNHFWTSDDTANKYDDIKVPVDERAKIVQSLQKNGRTPTDNLIKYMYLNSLKDAPEDK